MSSDTTEELRKTVAAGDWPAALQLWAAYAAAISGEIERGVCTAARLAAARDFLDWAKRVALCANAQAQQRLNAIHAAEHDAQQSSAPRSSLRASLVCEVAAGRRSLPGLGRPRLPHRPAS